MVDFGTRRHDHAGRTATSSATAPTTTRSATTPQPHQPSRLRQNWPASAVNSAERRVRADKGLASVAVMRTRLSRGGVPDMKDAAAPVGGRRGIRSVESGRVRRAVPAHDGSDECGLARDARARR